MPVDLHQRITDLCQQNGGLRAAATALSIDFGYLSRLANGKKTNPSDEVLAKLGLRRVVTYERTRGVRPVEASSRTAIDEIFDEAVSAAATANAGRPKEVSWVQAASDLANHSGVAPCANTYAGCAPECGPHNRCTSGGALPEGKSNG
jgi:hypothetical protein